VRDLYARRGRVARRVDWRALKAKLPGRSRHAIKLRAQTIDACAAPKRWTPKEERTLRTLWGDASQRTIMDALPGRTWRAIYHRAIDTGLPTGIPQGYVSITEAARRCGCSTRMVETTAQQFEIAITDHGTTPGAKGAWRMVEWDRIRDAFTERLNLETPKDAAQRMGVWVRSLRRAVEAYGAVPVDHKPGAPLRLVPSVFDDAWRAWVSTKRAPTTEIGRALERVTARTSRAA